MGEIFQTKMRVRQRIFNEVIHNNVYHSFVNNSWQMSGVWSICQKNIFSVSYTFISIKNQHTSFYNQTMAYLIIVENLCLHIKERTHSGHYFSIQLSQVLSALMGALNKKKWSIFSSKTLFKMFSRVSVDMSGAPKLQTLWEFASKMKYDDITSDQVGSNIYNYE